MRRDRLAHQSLTQLDAALLWRVSIERVAELRAIPSACVFPGSIRTTLQGSVGNAALGKRVFARHPVDSGTAREWHER